MEIPKINDIVHVDSDFYTGEATVTHVNMQSIYSDHLYPIQCEIDEADLHKIDSELNHGQRVVRFSLKEVLGVRSEAEGKALLDNEQGSLFDEF
ncbi:hypothetical protein AAG663_22770 (plasmid) [Bacillus licheniformis]|uniref:hypothetical protein n=1 Tax=Bacillus licheniformis TaxID=1402 RepID=UPI0009B74653|nr:hypothetical protein [Bacillus licheniformis]MDE1421987.1 hypothetical protein [Bacillus licheniformis]MEC0475992.1 hypothetical protein [Bacillus licheniformis]RHL12046.1 hypothetical protein DW032_20695 [Bacillus licheniformis]